MNTDVKKHTLLPSETAELKGRKDLLSYEEFESGMTVVVCRKCETLQLEDTWFSNPQGPRCVKCNCIESKKFDLIDFIKASPIHIPPHNRKSHNRKRISITRSRNGIRRTLNSILQAIRRFDLLDKLLDLSQAIVIVRCIAIIFIIFAGSSSVILHSQSKLSVEKMDETRISTVENISILNNDILGSSSKIKGTIIANNEHLLDESKSAFAYTKSSRDYLKREFDGVNYQIGVWFDSVIDWFENL